MDTLKVDKTKLFTVKNYATKIGKSVQWVYELIKTESVKVEKIDGVIFIKE